MRCTTWREYRRAVRATDPATDKTTSRVVTKTHRHADTELTDLVVKDAAGTTAVIHTTIHHRFWSTTRGAWIDASELREGEHLRSDDGEVLTVAGVRSFTGEAWMYDLTVDEVHSYYVVAGDDGVLVHNCGGEIGEGAQALLGLGDEMGILRQAARGKGNFGVGAATREEGDRLGRSWVGEGYEIASDGKTLMSRDGLRQFRPPSFKPSLEKWQANFEQRWPGVTEWQSNAHLDILDP
jgi:hypothetical protein